MTIVTPCNAIAGMNRGQKGAATQTSSAVADMQPRCAANCSAPRQLERPVNRARSERPSRARPGRWPSTDVAVLAMVGAAEAMWDKSSLRTDGPPIMPRMRELCQPGLQRPLPFLRTA